MNTEFNNFTETELTQEQWRDVEGYDGAYQVSDLGRVRSRKSGEWKVLSARKVGSGYLQVSLCKDGKKNKLYVHRLVAQSFIPNDNIFNTEINHRNEIKSDNRASNLEWCDRSYNNTYNELHKRRKNSVRRKIKKLYRQDLSIYDNIKLFKSNGIECSKDTVVRLRKDLGLSKNKRDKLKPLYRPDLSIAENIEIFNANGIECSKDTVVRLRKDLGLSKPRKKTN